MANKSGDCIPQPRPDDDEDVSWALTTAATLWKRGDTNEAIRWLQRAAKSAAESDQDERALEIGKAIASLSSHAQPGAAARAASVAPPLPPPAASVVPPPPPKRSASSVAAPAPPKPSAALSKPSPTPTKQQVSDTKGGSSAKSPSTKASAETTGRHRVRPQKPSESSAARAPTQRAVDAASPRVITVHAALEDETTSQLVMPPPDGQFSAPRMTPSAEAPAPKSPPVEAPAVEQGPNAIAGTTQALRVYVARREGGVFITLTQPPEGAAEALLVALSPTTDLTALFASNAASKPARARGR